MLGTIAGDDIASVGFDANTLHHKTADLFNPDRVRVRVLHAHDNVAYTDVWKCFYCPVPPATWSLANNAVFPYRAPATAALLSAETSVQPESAPPPAPRRRERAHGDRGCEARSP
jgi:hypothetical protein